ncbi:hypothetical protein NDU88_006573 [Pleurodeles waltl]|uniref:Uncharacterized protein n=1 Tax=Pleurodeles waltl TaxID=8319 RepID=A0AAV7NUF8_PLEWA|nr:hypothetical protein NDU88_006573 [Pleurodeles waltl]
MLRSGLTMAVPVRAGLPPIVLIGGPQASRSATPTTWAPQQAPLGSLLAPWSRHASASAPPPRLGWCSSLPAHPHGLSGRPLTSGSQPPPPRASSHRTPGPPALLSGKGRHHLATTRVRVPGST